MKNKLTVAVLALSAILLAGCRTAGRVYPTYDPTTAQGDQTISQKEYVNQTLQWQQEQQERDRLINNSRINNRNTRRRWWQWW